MISFEHANKVCTGTRLTVELQPPRFGEEAGSMVFTMCRQTGTEATAGSRFEDCGECKAAIALDAKKVAHVLMVLDGKENCIMGNKGVRSKNRSGGCFDILYIDAIDKPFRGFAVHIKSVFAGGEYCEERILLNTAEGAALRDVLRGSMSFLAFPRTCRA